MNVRFYLSYDIKIALKSHFYRKNVIILSLLFFFLFDSLRPINNLSVKHGQVFLG